MNLQDQCCPVDQAKRLKELGVKQVGAFSWFIATDRDDEPGFNRASSGGCLVCGHPVTPYIEEISAFTGIELGAAIPFRIFWNDDDYFPQIHKGKSGWYIQYQTNKKEVAITAEGELDRPRAYLFNTYRAEHNMAESFAQYLIMLLQGGAVTLDEINARL